MNIPPPDATHGPSQFWFRDTFDEAERLVTALRNAYGTEKIIPPPMYSVARDDYVITAVDVTDEHGIGVGQNS